MTMSTQFNQRLCEQLNMFSSTSEYLITRIMLPPTSYTYYDSALFTSSTVYRTDLLLNKANISQSVLINRRFLDYNTTTPSMLLR